MEVFKNQLYLSCIFLYVETVKLGIMRKAKPNVIKDFEKLEPEIQEQIKLNYQQGFSQHLITFTNRDGLLVSALPFETEEKNYLVRMTVSEAVAIIEEDDDYGDDGVLKGRIKDEYSDKYPENEPLADNDVIDEDAVSDDY